MSGTDTPRYLLSSPESSPEAFLAVEVATGIVVDCNEAAAALLGSSRLEVSGASWVGVAAAGDAASLVTHAASATNPLPLPAFIVAPPGGRELLVSGIAFPHYQQADVVGLLLWPLLDAEQLSLSGAPAISDTLAVLGVDQLCYDEHWGASDTARLMADIQASLLEIVRSADYVGAPAANAILITLRDVDMEGARDICRALLSHVHRQHTRPGTPTAKARICVGVAHRTADATALATLLAAHNALQQAQFGDAKDPIRAANEDDYKLLIGRMMNNAGIFSEPFAPAAAAQHPDRSTATTTVSRKAAPPVAPIEKDIEGYVVDNMEGAVDQAIFLARLDIPVAIIGPAGTGKMYVAKIIHDESGGATDMLIPIDCREFRSRNAANARITRELTRGEGKSLVFKSPHLMNAEVQLKLARQISSRTLADVSPPRYLPRMKLIALFPDKLEVLVRRGELTLPLASAFAGYPIHVPPIKDRKQAVLRWAHKILGQEGVLRDRDMKGFTPDAEQAMLLYDWPGNISEMRQCIHDALEKTDKDWLTPVDLGLFTGINPDGLPYHSEPRPFLATVQTDEHEDENYTPSALESLHVALGEAVHSLLALNMIKPLGVWIEDELVQAALDRYRGDQRRAADFLHTKPRNISRWLPRIELRENDRNGSALWQKPRRLLREWVRETSQSEESPMLLMTDKLLAHVMEQGGALGVAARASIMGVSTPTYLKRVREAAQG